MTSHATSSFRPAGPFGGGRGGRRAHIPLREGPHPPSVDVGVTSCDVTAAACEGAVRPAHGVAVPLASFVASSCEAMAVEARASSRAGGAFLEALRGGGVRASLLRPTRACCHCRGKLPGQQHRARRAPASNASAVHWVGRRREDPPLVSESAPTAPRKMSGCAGA